MKMVTDFTLGERIRQVRRNQGFTQKAFADSLGIAQGHLSSIEVGKKLPSDTLLIALTHLYRVDERWLLSGEGESGGKGFSTQGASPEPCEGKAPLLRRIAPDFSQGLKSEDILDYVYMPGITPGCYAIFAYGDFMAPTIQDEDLVLFKPGQEPQNGDIVLVKSKWDDILLRRYRVNADGIWLSPDNSLYKPFQQESRSLLVGIVTDIWRKKKL